jgi:hypothetical protein
MVRNIAMEAHATPAKIKHGIRIGSNSQEASGDTVISATPNLNSAKGAIRLVSGSLRRHAPSRGNAQWLPSPVFMF